MYSCLHLHVGYKQVSHTILHPLVHGNRHQPVHQDYHRSEQKGLMDPSGWSQLYLLPAPILLNVLKWALCHCVSYPASHQVALVLVSLPTRLHSQNDLAASGAGRFCQSFPRAHDPSLVAIKTVTAANKKLGLLSSLSTFGNLQRHECPGCKRGWRPPTHPWLHQSQPEYHGTTRHL